MQGQTAIGLSRQMTHVHGPESAPWYHHCHCQNRSSIVSRVDWSRIAGSLRDQPDNDKLRRRGSLTAGEGEEPLTLVLSA